MQVLDPSPEAENSNYINIVKAEALRFLVDIGHAQCGLIYQIDANLDSRDYMLVGVEDGLHKNYLDHYGDVDPLHARHYVNTDRNIVTDTNVGQRLSRRRDEYINDFLRPNGFNHIMEIFLRDESKIIAGLSLLRVEQNNPFIGDEAALIERAREYVEFNIRQLYRQLPNNEELGLLLNQLTKKERQVFELLCRGDSNKNMALALCVEASTIKTHLRHIYGKFNVENRRDLLSFVLKQKPS